MGSWGYVKHTVNIQDKVRQSEELDLLEIYTEPVNSCVVYFRFRLYVAVASCDVSFWPDHSWRELGAKFIHLTAIILYISGIQLVFTRVPFRGSHPQPMSLCLGPL